MGGAIVQVGVGFLEAVCVDIGGIRGYRDGPYVIEDIGVLFRIPDEGETITVFLDVDCPAVAGAECSSDCTQLVLQTKLTASAVGFSCSPR